MSFAPASDSPMVARHDMPFRILRRIQHIVQYRPIRSLSCLYTCSLKRKIKCRLAFAVGAAVGLVGAAEAAAADLAGGPDVPVVADADDGVLIAGTRVAAQLLAVVVAAVGADERAGQNTGGEGDDGNGELHFNGV